MGRLVKVRDDICEVQSVLVCNHLSRAKWVGDR